MKEITPRTIYLKDYRPPEFSIPEINLRFELEDERTLVTAVMQVVNVEGNDKRSLILQGEELKLLSVRVDGKVLSASDYIVTPESLTLPTVPAKFTLEIQNEIYPDKNTALEGLYKSDQIFCTQNEPEGFRRITYFLDRSDVMAKYTTTIVADKKKYPVLLSNGNKVGAGDLEGGKHFVKWRDPFNKPSYLFAMVAADLGMVEDFFVTRSGRRIVLQIFVDKGNESKCLFAMNSLKQAMKWDEDVFGLEYDLDIYMIVAVDAFNMGAMENKGLNIFNTNYVLADPRTATDHDFLNVQAVVGHEYFHNWTGNRVTCRDWFQLTLKEGLTVFRDQEFSADMYSRPVTRINDVINLRGRQFPEDAGPNSHPIRPSSYIEINNFYTATVYEKGAEVIRMVHTLIGAQKFRAGMDKYFELYDGMAVTTDDFLHAMELASGKDLGQFREWYNQAGTPVVKVKGQWLKEKNQYILDIEQSCPPTPGQEDKKPFHFPFSIGLIDMSGKEKETRLVEIKAQKERVVFEQVNSAVVPSLNRDFSAPLRVEYQYSMDEVLHLLAHDKDDFNRFDAAQTMMTQILKDMISAKKAGQKAVVPGKFLEAMGIVIAHPTLENTLKSLVLKVPAVGILADEFSPPDFDLIEATREELYQALALTHERIFLNLYQELGRKQKERGADFYSKEAVGERALRNTCLGYLCSLEKTTYVELAYEQFKKASNMTDELAALGALVDIECPERHQASREFKEKWKNEILVVNKWFMTEATAKLASVDKIKTIMRDSLFDLKIPNKVRSLVGGFAHHNLPRFHVASGEGYQFVAEVVVTLDKINPSIASGLCACFNRYARLDQERASKMKKEMEKILATPNLSKNVFEIVSKTLSSR